MSKALTISGILLVFLSACGPEESKCEPGEGAFFNISTQPDPAVVRPNGTDAIKVIAIGQDDSCEPFPAGTAVEFSIREQNPDGVGRFPNGETEITRVFGPMSASTEVNSPTPGTAQLHAYCPDFNLTALPVDIEFSN